jgi:SAM-dependent methyltransferase
MNTPASERFGEEYFRTHYGVTNCRPLSQAWWSAHLYAGLSRRLLKRNRGARMLEVGCGFGFILATLEKRYATFGVDISAHAIEQCRKVAPRSQCSVADLEIGLPEHLARGTFDLVLARYVFEHLRDPQTVMRELATLLQPGGYMLFAVPNTESLGARWKGRDWYAHQDPTHCSLLPPHTWLDFTRAAGLIVQREFSDGYWDVPYVRWLPRWVQLPIFVGPSALACLLARPILPARFGENVIIIAQQPARQEAQRDG